MKAGAEARSSEAGRRRRWQLEEAAAAARRQRLEPMGRCGSLAATATGVSPAASAQQQQSLR